MSTYLHSLNTALHESFKGDADVFLLGEDIVDPYGGAFKVSKGLSSAYPDRVFSTPISEGGLTGLAAGMAIRGLKPVVEIMFGDFLTLCVDQIVNHIAKFRGMYNGQVRVPVVIRTPMGGGRGYGATHSQSLEKLFLGVPEIRVIAPSHFHDPGALLKQVILKEMDPVLFIENKLLYPMKLMTEDEGLVFSVLEEIDGYPTVAVKNDRTENPDVTVIAYGGMSREIAPVMQSLADEEIRILSVFPSSLKPLPVETLVSAAKQSGRVIIVEEGTQGFNWGSEVAAVLYERLFNQLSKPILRLASVSDIIPAARDLEDAALVNGARIEDAVMEVLS